MQILKLQLINFKNYAEAEVDLSSKINVLVGQNGSGKTNLLDAIHFLSLTKSAFSSDQFCIRHGEQSCLIKGTFRKGDSIREVSCSLTPGKKVCREESREYQKLSEHIGQYPVVLIAPDDTLLVREGSEERRKFFDSMLSQSDRAYLDALIKYNYALRQRNSLLKMFAENNNFDPLALESYDDVLSAEGQRIFKKRQSFVKEFLPVFRDYYHFIVAHEDADVAYRSELEDTDFSAGLLANRQRDLFLQRTSFGIHRDDYQFTLGNGDLKRLGSQGQQKSFIIALKLAQFEVLRRHKGVKPILLLDDIFDKLDDFPIHRVLELIHLENRGQLFITYARPDRTANLLKEINTAAAIFTVSNGSIGIP